MSDTPSRTPWDVIVIGTGPGGAMTGYTLAKAGQRVLFLERGRSHLGDRSALTDDFAEAFATGGQGVVSAEQLARAGRMSTPVEDRSGRGVSRFVPLMGCGTGGSSALYGMALERLAPEDFTPRRNFSDVGDSSVPAAWPVTFEALRPYYDRIEALFGVSGTADPLRPEAVRTLKSPPSMNPANQELFDHLRSRGMHPYRLPMACDYRVGTDRAQGFLDSTGAKRDAAQVCLVPALRDFGATLYDQCEVVRLEASRDRVTEVVCLRGNELLRLRANQVVLAAGALATPSLLLNSSSSVWPEGLANRSGQVGRNLMRHHIDLYVVSTHAQAGPNDNLKELAFNDLYSADGLKLGTVQSFGAMPPPSVIWAEAIASVPRGLRHAVRALGPLMRPMLRKMFGGKVVLASIMEDLPHPENRVMLVGAPDAYGRRQFAFQYRVLPHDARRGQLFRKRLTEVFAPYRVRVLEQASSNKRLAHVCGTARFGNDPHSSVVDANCRAHGIKNLYVVDASIFPSSGGTNPTLTIAANAARVAEVMVTHDESAAVFQT